MHSALPCPLRCPQLAPHSLLHQLCARSAECHVKITTPLRLSIDQLMVTHGRMASVAAPMLVKGSMAGELRRYSMVDSHQAMPFSMHGDAR